MRTGREEIVSKEEKDGSMDGCIGYGGRELSLLRTGIEDVVDMVEKDQ